LLSNPQARWGARARNRVPDSLMGYSIRDERYRYTMWDERREGEESYDYSQDPRELRNLAASQAASGIREQMRRRLDDLIASGRIRPRQAVGGLSGRRTSA
jgi:uncharacterized sulfatase